jgi:ferredoxin
MTVQKVFTIYFSPTGTSKNVLKSMLLEFDIPKSEIDLTPYETRNNSYTFSENDLVIIGMPVYGGRISSEAEKRIKLLKGNNTPAVLVATYGNVHYLNALFELRQIVNTNGFITIAAATIVAEHNVVKEIASGRPNLQDFAAISDFVKKVNKKISCSKQFENIHINGKASSRLRNMQPIKPHGNKNCTNCGVCNKLCPTRSITNPRKTASSVCIRCMRCVKYCPQNARTYGSFKRKIAKIFLTLVSRGEKQPEFFL